MGFFTVEESETPSQHSDQGNVTRSLSPDRARHIHENESDAFRFRLREVIDGEKSVSFARRCGFSDSLLGAYLRGEKKPGLDNLIAIAAAGNVSIDWLATGRGQRERVPSAAPQPAPDNEAGEIAHIYSQATEPQRRAFRALAHAVRNPSLRAWLDLGIAVGEAADLTPAARTQTQKKEP